MLRSMQDITISTLSECANKYTPIMASSEHIATAKLDVYYVIFNIALFGILNLQAKYPDYC